MDELLVQFVSKVAHNQGFPSQQTTIHTNFRVVPGDRNPGFPMRSPHPNSTIHTLKCGVNNKKIKPLFIPLHKKTPI